MSYQCTLLLLQTLFIITCPPPLYVLFRGYLTKIQNTEVVTKRWRIEEIVETLNLFKRPGKRVGWSHSCFWYRKDYLWTTKSGVINKIEKDDLKEGKPHDIKWITYVRPQYRTLGMSNNLKMKTLVVVFMNVPNSELGEFPP